MKGIYRLNVLSAFVVSSIFVTVCHAGSNLSYDCVGMDSTGAKMSSTLTLTPTDKSNDYTSLWTYSTPGSTPDKGTVQMLGTNRMLEHSQDQQGVEKGQTELYQINDKQLLISYESMDMANKLKQKSMGLCSMMN